MRRVILGLIVVAFLASCGEDNPLIGFWTSEEATVEFRDDGTMVVNVDDRQLTGVWEVEDGKLKMTLTSPNGKTESAACDYRIAEDRLHITRGDERCGEMTFTRAP